jgi:hypothetical protein
MLLWEKAGISECDFFWRVFESKWVVLVFGRWCADVRERQIMWRLPSRALSGLAEIGIKNLFSQSPYSLEEVHVWMDDHDARAWEKRCMSHRDRGPNGNTSAIVGNRVRFVRAHQSPVGMLEFPLFHGWSLRSRPRRLVFRDWRRLPRSKKSLRPGTCRREI